jgi:hypothetical protein
MNYKVLLPSEGLSKGVDIKDLIRLHGADKSNAESASLSSQKGVLSKEEIKKIAWHIEKTMKVKVSDKLRNGEENMKVIHVQDLVDILEADMNRRFERFSQYPGVVEQLREDEEKGFEAVKNAPAFFEPRDRTVYLVAENFERVYMERCEGLGIDPESAEGKRFKKFLTILYFSHEEIHKTVAERCPAIGSSTSEKWAKKSDILMEYVEDEDKGPAKEEKVVKSLEAVADRHDALEICMEGIAHYTGYRVMCKLGYSKWAGTEFLNIRDYKGEADGTPTGEEVTNALNGIRFMEAVQIRTHENPVAFAIKHPPIFMRHIELPDEYLKDREAGKV